MRQANNPSQSQRFSDSGFVWEEKLTGSLGTIEVAAYSTVRVSCATAVCTVTIDGVLAATLQVGEVMIFNAGVGDKTDDKKTVSVTIAGAMSTPYVQVAKQ